MAAAAGWLILVVGPSGAGKDSILRGTANQLANDSRFVFPKRVVTRRADTQSEDHSTMSEMEFATAVAEDQFALWWLAHGNSYGIWRSIDDEMKSGKTVIINCSRAILDEAKDRYAKLLIVEVTAPPEVLVQRILARGRENEADAIRRVARSVPPYPAGIRVIKIVNDSTLPEAVERFTHFLEELEHPVSHPCGCPFHDEDQHEDRDDDRRGLVILE
jgi:phosphonate metabolism protein PhnN/1,5-bisphosphokinase (PRPP-forming)